MFQTLMGAIVLLAPFALIYCFSDRQRGFLAVFTGLAGFHIFTALLFQYFHIFTYSLILTTNILLALGSVGWFLKYKKKISFKFNPLFIFVVILIFIQLFSIRFAYNGTVSTIVGYKNVTQSSYSYPIFSDEWIASSLSKYSIESHSLPNVNTLDHNKPFKNLLIVFFSVLAQFFLILNLNPITNYPIMAIASGIIISFLVFNYLKINKVGNLASVFGMFAVPLIVNGANLPGVWFLIPFVSGLILFLVCLSALSLKDKKIFFASGLISFALYPPIIIFLLPAILFFIFREKSKKEFFQALGLLTSILIVVLLISYLAIGKKGVSFMISQIFRTNLDGGIPSLAIWNVIPWYVLVFSLLGIWNRIKEKDFLLLAPIFSGSVFWVFYTTTDKVFLIDYPRVVVITSVLLVVLSGYGLQYILEKLNIKEKDSGMLAAKTLAIFAFVLMFFLYPTNSWKKMVLQMSNQGKEFSVSPASPVNRYLNDEDLKIFSEIKNKNFIALPWKGLVIGVATNNRPLHSKSSVMSNTILKYDDFINANCDNKKKLGDKFKIDFAYTKTFSCPEFIFVASSTEGLNLYRFEK